MIDLTGLTAQQIEDIELGRIPPPYVKAPDYKFNEHKLLAELREYIDETYSEHYAKNKIQSTEKTLDAGDGLGFCRGSIRKYVDRYGEKDGFNRKDLLKTLHYALILLYDHDVRRKGITYQECTGTIEYGTSLKVGNASTTYVKKA